MQPKLGRTGAHPINTAPRCAVCAPLAPCLLIHLGHELRHAVLHRHCRDPENRLIGEWEPESQFEGIAYVPENDTFLLLHEVLAAGMVLAQLVQAVGYPGRGA